MSNLSFIFTFAAMMLVIIMLSGMLQGCTQLDKMDTRTDVIDIALISTDEECSIVLNRGMHGQSTDDSMTVDKPERPK